MPRHTADLPTRVTRQRCAKEKAALEIVSIYTEYIQFDIK